MTRAEGGGGRDVPGVGAPRRGDDDPGALPPVVEEYMLLQLVAAMMTGADGNRDGGQRDVAAPRRAMRTSDNTSNAYYQQALLPS